MNIDQYPYDYQMDIWRDISTGTVYVMDPAFECGDKGGESIPDQTWTIGQTCRWIHTGTADFEYDWPYTGYVGVRNSETDERRNADKGFYKQFLGFTWDKLEKEVYDLSFDIAFPAGHID